MIKVLFSQILNMSITASFVIIAVVLIRFILKKQPKIYSYILWSVVLFRLLCPWSFSMDISAFNAIPPADVDNGQIIYDLPEAETTFTETNQTLPAPQENIIIHSNNSTDWLLAISLIWISGIMYMVSSNLLSMYELKKLLDKSDLYYDNVYVCPYISTAIVTGIFNTKIYLPQDLTTEQINHILLHEKTHLRRKDTIIKCLAFAALCIHWFNPFVWIAFYLAEKDMEMSCDESVIKNMSSNDKYNYSQTLLSLSAPAIPKTQLAFGEGDVKGRVMNILNYKKPAFRYCLALSALLIATITALAVNPVESSTTPASQAITAIESDDFVYYTVLSGDTVWDIAGKNGLSVRELCSLNSTDNLEKLTPGNKLIVGKTDGNTEKPDESAFYLKSNEAEKYIGYTAAQYFKDNYRPDADMLSAYAYPAGTDNIYTVDMYFTENSEDGEKLNSYFAVLNVKETEPDSNYWKIDNFTGPTLVGTTDRDIYKTLTSDDSETDIVTDKFLWPVPSGRISRGFTGQYPENHNGIDISAATGTDIYAAESGTVIKALYTSVGNGIYAVIDHGDYTTTYNHCSELFVKMGETVEKGDIIAAVGSTGNSTGPHLHFGVYDKASEEYKDPYNYF